MPLSNGRKSTAKIQSAIPPPRLRLRSNLRPRLPVKNEVRSIKPMSTIAELKVIGVVKYEKQRVNLGEFTTVEECGKAAIAVIAAKFPGRPIRIDVEYLASIKPKEEQ